MPDSFFDMFPLQVAPHDGERRLVAVLRLSPHAVGHAAEDLCQGQRLIVLADFCALFSTRRITAGLSN